MHVQRRRRGQRRAGADAAPGVRRGAGSDRRPRPRPGALPGDLEAPRADGRAAGRDRLPAAPGALGAGRRPVGLAAGTAVVAVIRAAAGPSPASGPSSGRPGRVRPPGPPGPAARVGLGLVVRVAAARRPAAPRRGRARRTGCAAAGAAAPAGPRRGCPRAVTAVAPRQAACATAVRADHDVGAQPVHVEAGADRGDLPQRRVRQATTEGSRSRAAAIRAASAASVGGEPLRERRRVGVEGEPAAHHLGPLAGSRGAVDLDGEPEPVEQLRPQLAFLRVHGPDQQEPRRVAHRDAVALHVVRAQRRRVEQQVDQVVVQQVDLVDVEHAAVRGGQQPGLEGRDALGERALEVQRAGEPVLGRADRQLDQPGRARLGSVRRPGVRARPGTRVGRGRDRRRTGSRRRPPPAAAPRSAPRTMVDFAVPFSPRTSTPPIGRRDGVEHQRQPQVVHPDDAGERIGVLLIRSAVVAIEPVLPGFPRPKWRNSSAAGVSGSRVIPGHSCGTAPDSHRRSSASLPQHSMTYPPDAVPDSTGLPAGYTSPGPRAFEFARGARCQPFGR